MKHLFFRLSSVILLAVLLSACGSDDAANQKSKKKEALPDPEIDAKIAVQKGHNSGISDLAFSPDGKYVATGSYDNLLILWKVEDGTEVRVFRETTPEADKGDISSVAYSPDGKLIACGNTEGVVKLWNAETGEKVKNLPGHSSGKVRGVTFSPDGKLLLSGGGMWDKKLVVWDVATRDSVIVFKEHSNAITAAFFSPDGKTIYSAGIDSTIKIWDVEAKKMTKSIDMGEQVTHMAISPNGERLVANMRYKEKAQLVSTATGAKGATLEGYFNTVMFTPDGQILTSNNANSALFDAQTGKETKKYSENFGGSQYKLSPDSTKVAGVYYNDQIVISDLATGEEIRKIGALTMYGNEITFSPDGKFFTVSYTRGTGGMFYAYPLEEGATVGSVHTSGNTPFGDATATYWQDGHKVLAENSLRDVRLYDMAGMKELKGYEEKFTTPVSVTPDGKFIIGKGENDVYALFDAESGAISTELITTDDYLSFAGLSSDGKHYVLQTLDFMKVFEIPSGKELKSYEDREFGTIKCFDVIDGKYTAIELDGGKVILKDILTGGEIKRIADVGEVLSVGLSANKQFLALGCADWTAKLYDLKAGSVKQTFTGHQGRIVSVCVSPNGSYVGTASFDKTVKIWDAASGAAELCFIGIENPDRESKVLEYIVKAPNGRIDGPESAIKRLAYGVKEGGEKVSLDEYWDKIYTKDLIAKTLVIDGGASAE